MLIQDIILKGLYEGDMKDMVETKISSSRDGVQFRRECTGTKEQKDKNCMNSSDEVTATCDLDAQNQLVKAQQEGRDIKGLEGEKAVEIFSSNAEEINMTKVVSKGEEEWEELVDVDMEFHQEGCHSLEGNKMVRRGGLGRSEAKYEGWEQECGERR
ncbi:hypothetical protein VNO78_23854 [Psophocarpus tetragonolobus]|uniref:Uncharacterized protein n=1 Tax=Psophocarpus tetragonolobus TaxID=3891 RepID=A0AAN9XDZ2_PSOTE